MANKAISELPQAQNVNNQDLFVLEQSGIAKKLTAETFITEQGIIDALAEALDGHGGISSVTLSSVSGRVRTYLITFTDESATTFQVYDGTSIDRIVKTSTAGLVDTYTVFMNDGTTTFFTVTNGSKGDPGYPTDEQVTTAVNTWLDNNVTPGTGVVLDRTLTMSNAAAPADLVGTISNKVSYGEKYVGNKQTNTYTTTSATNINLRAPLAVSTGQRVTINATYTGSNATKYDIRFYDSNGQIHVIKTGQAFGTDYTFISGDDYTEISLYKGLSAAEPGKVFTCVSTVVGTYGMDIEEIQTDLTNACTDIDNIESTISVLRSGNIMPDLSDWIVGRVYNGVYSDSVTSCECTDYIPVIGGKTYYIYGGYLSQEYFGVYDENKAVINGWSFTSLNTNGSNKSTAVITLAATAKYIRINLLVNKISDFPSDAYLGLYPNSLPKTADMTDYVPRLKGNGTLSDKKILVVGDSISTDVYGSYKKWVTYLCESGFLSSGFVTNNSYHATGYVAVYTEGGIIKQDTFLNRVTALGDLSGYDLIVTFGGINDWIQGIDFDSFKAAVDAYYAYLIENATQARIAVLSPMRTALYGTTNNQGKTQKDYDDYIKSVASEYALPLLNLTDESGFCPEKSSTFSDMWTYLPTGYVAHDGVHPVADWQKKHLAPQIQWFLASLL